MRLTLTALRRCSAAWSGFLGNFVYFTSAYINLIQSNENRLKPRESLKVLNLQRIFHYVLQLLSYYRNHPFIIEKIALPIGISYICCQHVILIHHNKKIFFPGQSAKEAYRRVNVWYDLIIECTSWRGQNIITSFSVNRYIVKTHYF